MGQLLPASSTLVIFVAFKPGQQPCLEALHMSTGAVVGQLVPASSRFAMSDSGQQPNFAFLHDCLVVAGLVTLMAALVTFSTAGLVTLAAFSLVVTGQLLPCSSRCTVFVPGQHPNLVLLQVVLGCGGIVGGIVGGLVFLTVAL